MSKVGGSTCAMGMMARVRKARDLVDNDEVVTFDGDT
jgi:hypothetical protein